MVVVYLKSFFLENMTMRENYVPVVSIYNEAFFQIPQPLVEQFETKVHLRDTTIKGNNYENEECRKKAPSGSAFPGSS